MMAQGTGMTLSCFFSEVDPEHKCSKNGVVTYLDLFARGKQFVLACEIETTARHGVDNALKAAAVNIPLWIIVPTNKVKIKISRKLKPLQLRPGGKPIKILLLGQLERELEECQSLKPLSNQQTKIVPLCSTKGGW
jgi:hypothetical protein